MFGATRQALTFCAMSILVLIGSSAACAQLMTQWSTCALTVSGTTVPGAVSYTFHKVIWVYLSCHGVWYQTGTELIAVQDEPVCSFQLPSSFTGGLQMTAKDAGGAVLGVQSHGGWWTTFDRNGPPSLDPVPRVVRGFVGESVTVSTTAVPSDTSIRWLRNGEAMFGLTEAAFEITLDPDAHGTVYTPIATNRCGEFVGGARVVSVNPLPPTGLIDWRLIRTIYTGQQPGFFCNSPCGSPIAAPTVVNDFPSPNAQASDRGFAGTVGSGGTGTVGEGILRFMFTLQKPTRALLSGENVIGARACGGPEYIPCWGLVVRATVDGPTSMEFAASGTWGPVEVDLPAGEYTFTLQATGGSIPCSCVYQLQCGHSSASIAANFYQTCFADLNDDGLVSASDLVVIFDAWGQLGVSEADLDGDGMVSMGDLTLLLNSWGACW